MSETTGTAGNTRGGQLAALAVLGLVLIGAAGWIWRSASDPGEDAAPAAPAAVASVPAIAETMGEEGTLKIEVVSLERLSPGTLELRMAVTHVGTGTTALDIAHRFSADEPDRGTLSEVYLADLAHQRKLFILRDAEGVPVGSRDERPLAPGERRDVWAQYPALAAEEEAVVVHVPHAEPMPNVPITTADAASAPSAREPE